MHMKTFTSLLIGCSLALAGVAMAKKPDDERKKEKQAAQNAPAVHAKTRAKTNANVAKPQMNPARQRATMNERATVNAQKRAKKVEKAERNVSDQPAGNAASVMKQHKKAMRATDVNAKTTGAAAARTNAHANMAAAAKKPDVQKVKQIKQRHASFRAKPKPQQVPAVTFRQNYRIHGSDRWQGRQYEAFRSYHPERHDRHWYRSHFNRVELIGGGYYYWNDGYWYPAWGYDPGNEYYAYDAPIYVGQAAEPPDRVIADVQAELQEMGYYRGEVDGLLGPLTREALAGYQADQGLIQTEVIDEPTLDSLGLS